MILKILFPTFFEFFFAGIKAEWAEFGCRVLSCYGTGGGVVILWPISLQGFGILSRTALYMHIYLTVFVLRSDLPRIRLAPIFGTYLLPKSWAVCISSSSLPFFGNGNPVGSHLHRIMCNMSSLILSTTYFTVFLYSRFCFKPINPYPTNVENRVSS